VESTVDLGRPVLVAQASGKTGRLIVAGLAKRGATVLALVHRESARDELERLGASEVMVGDMFDESVLAGAMRQAGQVMLISPPMHPKEADAVASAVRLAPTAGVDRIVYYSALHPLLADVPHHGRKLIAERTLVESGLTYTVLQPGRYMQQLNAIWKQVSAEGVHSMPFSASAPFTLVDVADVAEVAAKVLTEPGHERATYQLAGPELLSQDDCAQILSDLVGKPVRAIAKPHDQFVAEAKAAGMPDYRLETMTAMNAHYDAHGLAANCNVLRWLLGREPTTFAQFVSRELLGDGR
jgi:uncharacterized protein YbjT (DUF2867 family)